MDKAEDCFQRPVEQFTFFYMKIQWVLFCLNLCTLTIYACFFSPPDPDSNVCFTLPKLSIEALEFEILTIEHKFYMNSKKKKAAWVMKIIWSNGQCLFIFIYSQKNFKEEILKKNRQGRNGSCGAFQMLRHQLASTTQQIFKCIDWLSRSLILANLDKKYVKTCLIELLDEYSSEELLEAKKRLSWSLICWVNLLLDIPNC